jgi:lipopolysaccharide/colanic/teichoic acid biosynthesis glycosyltransferase
MLHSVAGQPRVGTSRSRKRRFSLWFKQLMDYGIAGSLVLLATPLFILIGLAIRLTSAGPVFFVQERVGKDGRRFRFFKFRTMRHNADDSVHREFSRNFIRGAEGGNGNGNASGKGNGNGNAHANGNGHHSGVVYKMTEDPRVTRVGRVLRRTSLDELPQLFNVVRGEMSLVGPRPPVVYELEHYQEWHKRRLQAKPGITGLWQVSGRSTVPFDEMVLLDLHYIENRTTLMDVRIMLKTLPVVFKGDGAY